MLSFLHTPHGPHAKDQCAAERMLSFDSSRGNVFSCTEPKQVPEKPIDFRCKVMWSQWCIISHKKIETHSIFFSVALPHLLLPLYIKKICVLTVHLLLSCKVNNCKIPDLNLLLGFTWKVSHYSKIKTLPVKIWNTASQQTYRFNRFHSISGYPAMHSVSNDARLNLFCPFAPAGHFIWHLIDPLELAHSIPFLGAFFCFHKANYSFSDNTFPFPKELEGRPSH